MTGPSVLVAGSLHYDTLVTADRLPELDETLTGQAVDYLCGGKGANQAMAAAQHGAATAMAGCVGDDAAGEVLLENLKRAGVDSTAVCRLAGTASGMSVAIVTRSGDYGAVIVSAANLAFNAASVALPASTKVLLLQNEIPEEANESLARRAGAAGILVVLNAAPARPFRTGLVSHIGLLIVNRGEAAKLCDRPVTTTEEARKAALQLSAQGHDTIVTLGSDGAVLAERSGREAYFPATAATVHSTHGAGDSFTGALAARLSVGSPLDDSITYALAAAALHVETPPEGRRAVTPERVLALASRNALN